MTTDTLPALPDVPTRGWKLAPETVALIGALRQQLEHHAQELRDRYDDKSERWQEEKGADVDAWIDELADLADTLDNLETSADV